MSFSAAIMSVLLAIILAIPTGVEPVCVTDADTEQAVRKAAERAEVHGIGLYGPMAYRLEDVRNWPALVAEIRTKKGPGGRVWSLLGDDTRKWLEDEKLVNALGDPTKPVNSIKGAVASDLRKIINDPNFYRKEEFKGIALTKEMNEAIELGNKRTAYQTAKLNWALIDLAFPGCFPAIPDRFRTVRVQVVGGSDVVLVLSSYERCRWEITLREGARVTGVVLCGYHAQEIVGVDAPTLYRAYHGPDGVSVAHLEDFVYGYNKQHEAFPGFLKAVKSITGKVFTKLECANRPKAGDEPFTIHPKAK